MWALLITSEIYNSEENKSVLARSHIVALVYVEPQMILIYILSTSEVRDLWSLFQTPAKILKQKSLVISSVSCRICYCSGAYSRG